jgi:hypothetical protein
MNIRPVGAELFQVNKRTDGQTDMKVIIAFRNFAIAPKTSVSELPTNNKNRHTQTPFLENPTESYLAFNLLAPEFYI